MERRNFNLLQGSLLDFNIFDSFL